MPDAEDRRTSSFTEAGLTAEIETLMHNQGFNSPTEIQVWLKQMMINWYHLY